MNCPKCHGLLAVQAEYCDSPASVFCFLCGGRWYLPIAPTSEPDPQRSWDRAVCTICMGTTEVMRGMCRSCRNTDELVVKKREIRQRWEARR